MRSCASARPRRAVPPISSGSSTFWSVLRQGRSVESWNTKPNTRRRRATPGGSPPTSIRPSVGARISATSRSSVDFPQPEGPRRERNSRGWIARLAPASAWRGPEGVENVIPTSSTRIPAGAVAPALLAPGPAVDTLEDVLRHRVLRGDGRLQESEVPVDLDRVPPDLRLHPAPALLLGPVRPEERRLPLPRRELQVAFEVAGVLQHDVDALLGMIGRPLPAPRARREEVRQHVRARPEHLVGREVGEGVEADAHVPEQEGLGLGADRGHLGRVDDPARDHVHLAGLERGRVRADHLHLDLLARELVFRDDGIDERPGGGLDPDLLADEVLRRADALVERD